MIKAIGS